MWFKRKKPPHKHFLRLAHVSKDYLNKPWDIFEFRCYCGQQFRCYRWFVNFKKED